MLKKILFVLVLFTITATVFADDSGMMTPAKYNKYEDHSNFYRIGRGFTNLTTGWLEVPRCMLYQNSNVPVLGLIIGAGQGAIWTGGRVLSGVADIMFLGFDYGLIFSKEFPDFVWQANWLPPAKQIEAEQKEDEKEIKEGQDQI